MEQEDLNPYAAPQSRIASVEAVLPAEAPSAGQGKRFLNFLIDRVAVVGVFVVLGVVVAVLDEMGVTYRASAIFEEITGVADFLFSCVVSVLYYSFFEGLFGRSIGKWITGTKVVTVSGEKLSFGTAFMRSLARLVPFEAFSFLGSGEDTGWHDKWTDTRVVDLRAKPIIKPRPMKAGSMPRMYTPQMPARTTFPPPPSPPAP